MRVLSTVPMAFVLGMAMVSGSWDGSPRVLLPRQTVHMPQTPNGSTVFTYENQTLQNSEGTISVRSGGAAPVQYSVPALRHQPSYLIENWGGNDLTVANVSVVDATAIRIQDVGPGEPGPVPKLLPTDGTMISLAPRETAQTLAVPTYMQMLVRNTSGLRSEVVVLGGPPDAKSNNAYSIAINTGQITGPPTNVPATAPYYATTTSDFYNFPFSWGSSTVFVVNLSAETSGPVQISLVEL